jgi:hypothetical protein
MLKKGEVTFRRKQNVLLISLQDKRLVNMVSNLHAAVIVILQDFHSLIPSVGFSSTDPLVAAVQRRSFPIDLLQINKLDL